MIFDAFGRLALGQVQQNFANTVVHLGGVAAAGAAGAITATKALSVNLPGISGTGTASGFSGGSVAGNGTPIGILSAITLGSTVSSGDGTKIIAKTDPGVTGTGAAGSPFGSVSVNLVGVQGSGLVGFLGNAKFIGFSGVFGTGTPGTITTLVTGFGVIGVSAAGAAGNILDAPSEPLVGVAGTGLAGTISFITTGGGGNKPKKTGLEPIKKRPPPPPVTVKIPTYVVPPLPQKAPRPTPALAKLAEPFVTPTNIQPLNLTAMRDQIQAAQDQADINAVLEFLDTVD